MTQGALSRPAPTARAALLRHPVLRLFASMAVVQGSLFVSGTLLVRSLGVDQRGEVALVSAMVGIGSQVGLMGLPPALVYFVSSRRLPARRVLEVVGRGFLAQMAVVAVLAAAGLVVLSALGEPMTHPWSETVFTALGVVVFMSAAVCLAAIQGEQRYTALTVLQALPILVYAALVAILFLTGQGSITTFLVAINVGWALVPVAAYAVLREGRGDPEAVVPGAREVRAFGVRSALASASPTDLLGIDQVIIGVTLGHAPLGLYVVGWAFETATVLPGNVLAGFVGPQVAAAPPQRQLAVAWKWVGLLLAGSLAICAVVEALLPWLVVLAFGEAARGAVPLGRILVAGGVLLGLRKLLGVVLQSLGRPQWSTWAELASLTTMVGGVLVLGAAFGIRGACVAMGLAGLVGSVVQLVMLARFRPGDRAGTGPSPAGPTRP